MSYKELQLQLDSFIGKFGTLALLKYLSNYQNMSSNDLKDFENVVLSICKIYKLSIKEVQNIKIQKSKNVDARRILIYFLVCKKNYEIGFLSSWLNCTKRTIYKYKDEAIYREQNPKIFKNFNEQLNQLR
tara:strand:+ start:1829 stop:2218 length:390 start_codon:yes stop_codon:yes gene_type:complete